VEQTVLSPSMILAGGLLCQDGWAAPSMRLQAFHSHQLTNLSSTSKVLTMRLPVGVGKKVNEHSHFEAIPIGWVFQSVPILMWWQGGVSPVVSSSLMLGSCRRQLPSSDLLELRKGHRGITFAVFFFMVRT